MTIHEIRKQAEEKHNENVKNCGVFFAFNNEQFAEGLKDRKVNEIVSIGAGGYMPKENVEKFVFTSKEIEKWKKEQIKTYKLSREHILYELYNHECFYTGDLESVSFLPYTAEEIRQVYVDELKKKS